MKQKSMLTQETLEEIFNVLRKVHRSHWRVPLLKTVEKEIARVGKYVFRMGNDRSGAVYQYRAEIRVATFADSQQPVFAARTVLSWC